MKMKIGDEVRIIKSPYYHVKKGTIARIVKIYYNPFGKGNHLYLLDLPDYNLFREHEIEHA